MTQPYPNPQPRTMGFVEAVKTCFSKYVDFSGRASRAEFWWWYLFTLLIGIVLNCFMPDTTSLMEATANGDTEAVLSFYSSHGAFFGFTGLVNLALLLPSLAVMSRRLHDIGCSAWWMLLYFTCVGVIALLIMTLIPGQAYTNKYGPVPGTRDDQY